MNLSHFSSNGTFVNGIRAPKGKPVLIKNHDRISFVVSGGMFLFFPLSPLVSSSAHTISRIDVLV
jgi:hypothetical protein